MVSIFNTELLGDKAICLEFEMIITGKQRGPDRFSKTEVQYLKIIEDAILPSIYKDYRP